MSKLIYLCARKEVELPFKRSDIEIVFTRLTPDNLKPKAPRIIEGEGVLIGILNPADSLPSRNHSVCLGALFEHREDWWQPGAEVPDGSYALFRGDGETLELVSDIVCSRTIWYVQTEDLFIASTSQRAIVCFLQSYESREAVYPWMLSSGTLGPGLSWDRRIRCLGSDSRLTLDRRSWGVTIDQRPVVFAPEDLPLAVHEHRLREAMEETFARLDVDPARWVLPLSGGYDSRAILLMLKNRAGLKTVTWGLRSALKNKRSDAWVAQELARYYGVIHEYFETGVSEEPIGKIFDRFLVSGEGRTDHIAGYMDGLSMWKRLYESGCQGILRGDEAFGCRAVQSDQQVHCNMGLTVLSDFGNIDMDAAALGFDPGGQKRPEFLERRQSETREMWRDRVNAEFEIPSIFAALGDHKLSYVEIINPLLSRRIVETVRTLPDELRTGKALFMSIITRAVPDIKYAKYPAIEARGDILRRPEVAGAISNLLQESSGQGSHFAVMSRYALNFMEDGKSVKQHGNRALPARILRWVRTKSRLEKHRPPMMDSYQLGFRVYIILRMNEILSRDAEALRS
jgi:hypothetical protein